MLDSHFLGRGRPCPCGDSITLAAWPNVAARLGRLEALPHWNRTFEAITAYAASLKGPPMVAV